jgi:PD-(D/E)XK nuclease superfamily
MRSVWQYREKAFNRKGRKGFRKGRKEKPEECQNGTRRDFLCDLCGILCVLCGKLLLLRSPDLIHEIIGAAIMIHRELGPGLLESAYEACLAYELQNLGMKVERQKAVPLIYKSVKLDCGFRADLVVETKCKDGYTRWMTLNCSPIFAC